MSPGLITLIIMVALFVVLVTGLPVAFCLFGLSVLLSLIFVGPSFLYMTYLNLYRQALLEIYIAIPLFVFMAAIMEFSGVGADLFNAMYKWAGGVKGGLAIGTIAADTILAAMTGLGGTDTIIMGMVALPEMRKRGYSKQMAIGPIPAGGALGPLIPPSVLMIVLSGLTGVSVGQLFIAGIFPGLLMAGLFIIYIAVACGIKPTLGPALPKEDRASWAEKFISIKGMIIPVVIIFAVLGSIYAGIATPTESASIGALGILIVTIARRRATSQNMKQAMVATFRITAMVMWLLIGGSTFSALITTAGAGKFIADLLGTFAGNPIIAVIIMMLIGVVLGMFMDTSAVTMICIPVFWPVVRALGINPVWFLLLFTVNMVLGYVSPPFGMNLFYLKGIAPKDISMADIYRASIPFCIVMLVTLALCMIFPPIATWLPSTMMK